MSDIVQLYSDKSKTKKAYPKTLASETYMSNGGTVESQLAQIENKNIDQDTKLEEVARVNKTQQVYINGLFNENKDGRLSVEGEGNDLKLEGSKEGLVEVDKVVGNTFVNIANFSDKEYEFTLNSGQYYNTITLCDLSLIEVNTDYTLLFDIEIVNNTTTWSLGSNTKFVLGQGNSQNAVSGHPVINSISNNGISYNLWNTICYSTNVVKFNLSSLNTTYTKYFAIRPLYSEQLGEGQSITYKVKNLMLFKGDITSNPPKEYIEGLQSSFESNLVTQEMVTQGLESEENLGKYKVPVRLVGKNLFTDINSVLGYLSTGTIVSNTTLSKTTDYIKVQYNTNYTIHCDNGDSYLRCIEFYDSDKNYLNDYVSYKPDTTKTFRTSYFNVKYIRISYDINATNIQLEEGIVATDYEEYFERTTNVYLNSPLLKGDEIVWRNGELCHYHKCGKSILDSSKSWSLNNANRENTISFQMYFNDAMPGTLLICDRFVSTLGNVPIVDTREIIKLSSSTNSVGLLLFINIFKFKLVTQDVAGFKTWLQSNPIKVVYELAEPYYEPINSDNLILECANNSTIHIDSVVPVESVKASYTGNVPSVYAIEETGITNTEDISVTQTAVDFLLMSSMGEVMMMSFNENTRGGNNMGAYFASRIIKKALKYEDVIRKYPEFKDDIDFILRSEGYENLIVEVQ